MNYHSYKRLNIEDLGYEDVEEVGTSSLGIGVCPRGNGGRDGI